MWLYRGERASLSSEEKCMGVSVDRYSDIAWPRAVHLGEVSAENLEYQPYTCLPRRTTYDQ